ncbi:MAG: hypothetical protein ACPLRP_03460 [Candidatus Bipolaricaulaceae bacterium]
MPKRPGFARYVWVLGGLALGGVAGLVLGVLVFWVYPALQKAHSPLKEVECPPLVLHHLKDSPVAQEIETLKVELRSDWLEILEELGLSSKAMPSPIHLYIYSSPAEVGLGISARMEEERTFLAVGDLVVSRPMRGDLARLACSLAFGRPGNPLFPRGLALYFADPQYPWAEEAGSWAEDLAIREIWARADRVLPRDPWEDLFFQVDAPWAGATMTLEKIRTVLSALGEPKSGGGRIGEVFAASLAQWVVKEFGRAGVQRFWTATSWEGAASGVQMDPQALAQDFQNFLLKSFEESPNHRYLLALKEIHSGRPTKALHVLAGLADPQAQRVRGLAYLALGEVEEAVKFLGHNAPELLALASAPRTTKGSVIVVGSGEEKWAWEANEVLARAAGIWPEIPELIPERLVFYVTPEAPRLAAPWGVTWVRDPAEIPERAARSALEALCPWGLPPFKTIVEGLVLWLVFPDRDFRAEAKKILVSERWVSLTQNLFGVYPQDLAEAEAGAFVTFILEKFGPSGMRSFWAFLYEGASVFRATELAFSRSFRVFEEELKNWLKQP